MVRPARLVALLAALVAVAAVLAAPAQAAGPRAATTPWLLVSDVHFDPFAGADAARVARLQAAPVRRWGSLLAGGAPSPWGQDTNATLLASSLRAMRRAAPDPPVVLIAGDLLAHDFQQTYEKLAPDASPADYRAFVDKTMPTSPSRSAPPTRARSSSSRSATRTPTAATTRSRRTARSCCAPPAPGGRS